MRRIVGLSLGLTLAVGAQAELLITDFRVEANVLGHSTDADGEIRPFPPIVPWYITDNGLRRRAMEKSDDQPLALPWALTSQLDLNVCNDGHAPCDVPAGNVAATQTKTGWFESQAVIHHGFFPDFEPDETITGEAFAFANTLYYTTVETTTPDTPLVLHFVFEGARAGALAHYGGNGIEIDVGARISAMKNAPAGYIPDEQTVVWETGVSVDDGVNGFEFTARDFDAQGIGVPSMTTDQGWVPSSFQYRGEVSRGTFVGTLDFGLLQPGETFSFSYASFVYLSSYRNYPVEMFAQVVDPFALETPFPAFELEGLALLPQPSSVPVPGAALMMLSALGTLLGVRAARRAGAAR